MMTDISSKTKGISIIIPTHNSAIYITETLDSVVNQTGNLWECIIVDDASTDNTEEIVPKYLEKDNRFNFIKASGGGNRCRNIGIRNSRYNLLLFLDSDDILKPDCIRNRLAYCIDHPDIDFSISQTGFFKQGIDESNGHFYCNSSDIDELICDFIQHKIKWTTTAPTWRRDFLEAIGGWNEKYPRLQDVELNPNSDYLPRLFG